MNANKILGRKGRRVFTVISSATLAAAVSRLTKCRVGALVVTNAHGSVAGIVSERDIVRALGHNKGAAALVLPIAKIMTNTVVTCTENSTLNWIMNKMTQGRYRNQFKQAVVLSFFRPWLSPYWVKYFHKPIFPEMHYAWDSFG